MFSSVFSLAFFAYLVFVWMEDVLCFAGFYGGFHVPLWLGASLAAVGAGLAVRPWIRKKRWNREKISLGEIGVMAYLSLFALTKMMMPDVSEDVCKYHIFLQQPVWKNMISYHLMPGGTQGFVFQLGDRLFYLFRALLGYRLGTVWNLICLLLIFLQARRILGALWGERWRKFQPLMALMVTAQYDALMQAGSYMVELTAGVLVMECIWLLLGEPENKGDLALFAALLGFAFAIKMTNVIYVLPLLGLYLYKNRKKITVKVFGFCFLAGALPVSIYLIHNWIQVADPVYPYFKNIFPTPWYKGEEFKDMRWGGQNWKEKLLWLVYAIARPKYRQSELPLPYTLGYGAAGLVGGAGTLWGVGKKGYLKEKKNLLSLGILTAASALIWSFSTGHARYYMIGFMILTLWGIGVGGCWCGKCRIRQAAMVLAAALVVPGPLLSVQKCLQGVEWSFRTPLSGHIYPGGIMTSFENKGLYQEQAKLLGKDRKMGTKEQQEKTEKLVIIDSSGAFASLFHPGLPVVDWATAGRNLEKDLYQQYGDDLKKELEDKRGVYAILRVGKGQLPWLFDLYQYRFAVRSVEQLPQNIFPYHDFYLIGLANPADEGNDCKRQRLAPVLGQEETLLGQVLEEGKVTLWIQTPGIGEGPGLTEESFRHVKLEILAGTGEEREVVKETELDLRENKVQEIQVEIGKSPVSLYGVLRLPEEESHLAPLAGAWARTSLTGRLRLDDGVYYVGESGLVVSGTVVDKEREYRADDFGKMYGGWADVGEDWYFLTDNGYILTGWLSNKYYLGEDGVMLTGKQIIDGVEYEFGESGRRVFKEGEE